MAGTPAGGFVFAAGSLTFGGSLVEDPQLQAIVRNILDECLGRLFHAIAYDRRRTTSVGPIPPSAVPKSRLSGVVDRTTATQECISKRDCS